MKKIFTIKKYLVFVFLLSSCNKRIERESIVYYESEALNPKLVLKQEILNCSYEDEACYFEKYQLPNLDDTIINGVIYPTEAILNTDDINLAPQFQFSFEHLDYSEIEKIEYKYIKYDTIGNKIAETNYKTLSFIDNDYKIPLHLNTLGAGILITEHNQTNEVQILIRTYTNYYFKASFKFYMFSQVNAPLEISRDAELLNTAYYKFENSDLHVLDIINLKNKLNLKLSLNLELEINNITKASIQTSTITNYTELANLQGPNTYRWKNTTTHTYNTSKVNPSFLIFIVDELGQSEQILFNQIDNFIYIDNLIIKENKNISLIVVSNFLKLNILGDSNLGPIYSNYSHCQNISSLHLCRCWYNANSVSFPVLFMSPPNNPTTTILLATYITLFSSLANNNELLPNCNIANASIILSVSNIYRTNKSLIARLHKTNTNIYLDIKLKDYTNFGTILEKYISFPELEVRIGELSGEETLYGYVR